MIPAIPLFKCTVVTADAAVKAAAGRLIAASITATSDAAAVILYDDPNSADGTKLLQIGAPTGGTTFVDLSNIGGVLAALGIYADISGTSAVAMVWFE